MVILSANGFQNKEKCGELLKVVKNKKVLVCTNAIEREIYKKSYFEIVNKLLSDIVTEINIDDLNSDNVLTYITYYDCIYIADGNLKRLSEMLTHQEVEDGILSFINSGKIFITEGKSSLITVDNLEYVNFIVKSLDEENNIYPTINYSTLKTLKLTTEKIIVCADALPKHFQGACRITENHYKLSLTYLHEGELIVL